MFNWGRAVIISIFVLFLLLCPPGSAEYMVRPDGSILYDNGQIAYGIPTFTATDDIKYLKSDYHGASLIDQGLYWSTPEPSPLSGRFYDDGRIYLGKNTDHYIGMQPMGIFYVNYQDPTEREQLISLTSMSLSVNDNVAIYSQGQVSIIFTNSFSQIKGDVIFPNTPPVPTVSNPALAVVWEVVGHAGISMEDGGRDKWWFEQAKAAFPVGDIQNNGSAVLKKKIFRQNGKIYLVEGVGYGWVSDVNRTDSRFIIDPTLEYNGSDNWAGTSGDMIEHGDGYLRAPPSVTTGLVSYWSFEAQTGNTAYDVWTANSNDGTFTDGVTGNWTASGKYGGGWTGDGINDIIDCGSDESMNLSNAFTVVFSWKYNGVPSHDYASYMRSGWGDFETGTIASAPNRVGLYIRNSTGHWLPGISTNTMSQTEWNFVTGTFDNSLVSDNYKLLIDGDLIYGRDYNGTLYQNPQSNIYLGGAAPKKANGTLDEVYYYNVGLSSSQTNETRDNYHTNSSYRQIDTANDYGAGQVLKYINVTGTDPSANTTMAVYVNGSHDNVTFNGWELVNGSCNFGDNITVPIAYEYRYTGSPGVKIESNTSYQPETNIFENVLLVPAPVYTVSGTIYGAAGLGEGQVTVTLGTDSTTTSSSGSYSFTGISAGTYTLTASKSGLQDASTTITVSSDTTQDLTMARAVSPGGGGQDSSDWGVELNISGTISQLDGPISCLEGLVSGLQVPHDPDPRIKIFFGLGVLCIGVFFFVDGLAFRIDKSRHKTFTKIKYQVLIAAGLGLGVLGAAISKLIIFN